MRIRRTIFTLVWVLVGSASMVVHASNCSSRDGSVAALIRTGNDSRSKTPLILIHGKGGTSDNGDITKPGTSWKEFQEVFGRADSSLADRFAVYFFQYCSDRSRVADLAAKLRDLIDIKLPDRDHVILAHSLGGLIAKSYMAETIHTRGRWQGKKGGDTTLGLITLATPHHGTPGANAPETVQRFVPDRYEAVYGALQNIYWRSDRTKNGSVLSTTSPNRADLRWDNYDKKLEESADINTDLARTNSLFEPYNHKLIAYGGTAEAKLSAFQTAALLLEVSLADSSSIRQHRMLSLANVGLVNGLGRHFGDADGLVPLMSALFCKTPTQVAGDRNPDHVCAPNSRVRRFEPGERIEEVASPMLPDEMTLSIVRNGRGFDHLDMLTHADVLKYVVRDLAAIGAEVKPISRPVNKRPAN